MAFDAGMLACAVSEIKSAAIGGRIEKIYQPERDEILIQLRTTLGAKKILINAGSNNPRICFSDLVKDNPASPPMLCMLLRKHLNGGTLLDIEQLGFERAARLSFRCRDEMGFECVRYIIAEVMGKCSNLIFADENMKVITSHKTVDFTTSSRRQVLPGMKYELPPAQDKSDPLDEDENGFAEKYDSAPAEDRIDKFIMSSYFGIAPSVAREIAFRATRHTDTPISLCSSERVWHEFSNIFDGIKNNVFSPSLVYFEGKQVEYAFTKLTQYTGAEVREFESAGSLLDTFYGERDREMRVKQKASDLLRLLSSTQTRIARKLENQRAELAECEHGEEYKRQGDMINANIYAIQKGQSEVELTDYSSMNDDGSFPVCRVKLDTRLTPAANAQRLYKKYSKAKHAKIELVKQIEIGESELSYLATVSDSLDRAETSEDLSEIRAELYSAGYASKMKGYTAPKKLGQSYMKFRTDGGFTVLCGRNNIQNEYITHKIADKNDYWFHIKSRPGSHAILMRNGEEPGDIDFTQAARIAALYSSDRDGQNIGVDYTLVKNLKKAPGAKPGFVIYHTNWTAYVTPDKQEAERIRIK